MKNKGVLWVTQTAVLLALVIVMQALPLSMPPLLRQFITGPIVNLILLASVFLIGLSSSVTISIISPFFAYFMGQQPLFPLIPFVVVGNLIIVVIAWFFRKNIGLHNIKEGFASAGGLVLASVVKFLFFWLVLTMVALPMMNLPAPQLAMMSTMFSWPQLVTALAGSVLAMIIVPLLKRALKR